MSAFGGITRLVAEGFRGATSRLELVFEPDHPFVLFFGENGTGKSSIVDAIEFVFHGSKGSLDYLSSTRLSHLASLGTPAPPLRVELHAGDEVWRAGLRGSKPERSGPQHPPRVEILRRPRLARIVAATPLERYEELAGFIDIQPVEAAERSLETAVKEAARGLEESARRQADAEARLKVAWEADGRPGDSARAWAGAPPTDPPGTSSRAWLATSTRVLERLIDVRARAARSAGEVTAAEEVLGGLGTLRSDSPEDGDVALVSLLTAAQEAVGTARELAACPVCRQPVNRDSLRADLEQRLSRLQDETERLERRQEATADLRSKRDIADRAVRELEEARADLRSAVQAPAPGMDSGLVAELESLASEPSAAGAELGGGGGGTSSDRLDAALRTLHGLGEAERRLETERARLAGLVGELDRLEANGRRLAHQHARLTRALEIVRSTRKAFTDHLLAEVEGEVNRLYTQLHPDEGLGPIRLRLDPNRRASLLQSAAWGDAADLAPQACFSESHLLTLAFCLWFALAKRDRPGETVLVLDDVVFALDAPHTRRLAALLAAEAPSFAQVLVTTHSRGFLRDLRGGIAPAGNLDCRTLRWTLAGGIVHGASPHDAERLAAAVAEPILDRGDVASRAGRLLEALLRQLAMLYRRRVPFAEPTEPDLGDLLSSWRLKDADRVRVERLAGGVWEEGGTFGMVLKSLHSNRHVRNLVGAHFNTAGDEVPDAEVLAYGRGVLDLWSLLVCPHCGQIPCKPQADLFVCHCKRTRMRPNRLD